MRSAAEPDVMAGQPTVSVTGSAAADRVEHYHLGGSGLGGRRHGDRDGVAACVRGRRGDVVDEHGRPCRPRIDRARSTLEPTNQLGRSSARS